MSNYRLTSDEWTNERCEQLDKLRRLLNLAESLNRSSNVVGNIQVLETLATELKDHGDFKTGSFFRFLEETALDARQETVADSLTRGVVLDKNQDRSRQSIATKERDVL